MRKVLMLVAMALVSSISFSGCAGKNVFGVGYSTGGCTSANIGGVCGSAKAIYKYSKKVKKIQKDYRASLIKKPLWFRISDDGVLYVKDKRTGGWTLYEGSVWEKKINKALYGADVRLPIARGYGYYGDTGGDLSDKDVSFRPPAKYIQTSTNTGELVRTTGRVQKIWIAPVVDKNGDLVSAHEVYAVTKKPEWVVGERTNLKPKATNTPTPISTRVVKETQKTKKKEDDVIKKYISN
jgi:hypothetical protein